MTRMRVSFVLLPAVLALASACESAAPAPTAPANPLAMAPTTPASPVPPQDPSLLEAPVTPPAASSSVHGLAATRWTVVALTAAKTGQVLIRCEEPEHPQDVAGGCLCGSTILDPCDEHRPQH